MGDPLEARLADLAGAIEWPATPSLAAGVGAQLKERAQRRAEWEVPWARASRRGIALALAASLLIAGVTIAAGVALGGWRLVFGEPAFTMMPISGTEPFGTEVTLEQARARADFELRLPSVSDLGEPDRAYFAEPPVGGQVTLLWTDRSGFPAHPERGWGLALTEFGASIGPEAVEKLIADGTRVDQVEVGGRLGYWIEGGEHFIYYVDATGEPVETTVRFAGDTLVWEADGLVMRVEGAPDLEAALRVAESVGE